MEILLHPSWLLFFNHLFYTKTVASKVVDIYATNIFTVHFYLTGITLISLISLWHWRLDFLPLSFYFVNFHLQWSCLTYDNNKRITYPRNSFFFKALHCRCTFQVGQRFLYLIWYTNFFLQFCFIVMLHGKTHFSCKNSTSNSNCAKHYYDKTTQMSPGNIW